MSIAALNERIAQNQQRIATLEEECKRLKIEIERLYDEEGEACRYKARFETQQSAEMQSAEDVKAIANMRAAPACGQDLGNVLTGAKAEAAANGFVQILNTFKKRIEEDEEQLRQNQLEIERLDNDITSCRQEIADIQERERRRREAERREAARQAAANGR